MKPAIVIPTYWSSTNRMGTSGGVQCYDHAIPIDAEDPSLDACLGSLEQVLGLAEATVILLVVAPPAVEEQAVHRVREIADAHPALPQVVIVDSFKSQVINTIIASQLPADIGEPISLRGYGAIRNMGLIVCCAFGCDAVIFLDDDETVIDENFLANAVYGFGLRDRSDMPIIAKSGCFLDSRNSALADRRNVKFYDKHWAKRAGFNEWMTQALQGPRISESPHLCGGCFALHAEAFTRVAFDPWITRGEDEDYLINLRMYGISVWFDNKWRVRHRPPRIPDTAPRFRQDVYRWTYERRKIEVCNANIDLQKIYPSNFMPYPGPWIGPDLPKYIRKTSFWRSIMTKEHAAYFDLWRHGLRDATEYADQNCTRYLGFQEYWNKITTSAWLNGEMQNILVGDGMLNREIASRMAVRAGAVGQAPLAGAAGQAAADAGTAVVGANGQVAAAGTAAAAGTVAAGADTIAPTATRTAGTAEGTRLETSVGEPRPVGDQPVAGATPSDKG